MTCTSAIAAPVFFLLVLAACSVADDEPAGPRRARGGAAIAAGTNGADASASTPAAGAAGSDAQTPSADSGTQADASSAPKAFVGGNPNGSCQDAVPARAQPVNVSAPTSVVGTGSASSCTHAALAAAVANGGVIVFDCGGAPVTIAIEAPLDLRVDRDTVVDGGNKITLDGGGKVRVFRWYSPNFRATDRGLTLQHLRVIGGTATPTVAIPSAPAPCSQGFNDGEGGAIYMRDGQLTIIDSVFEDNHAAPVGPDTGGGAIYVVGSKGGLTIAKSTFTNNTASNGGAVGSLFAQLDVYDSLFTNNTATGSGANYDDATKCDAINNGQHEVGSGGNGGALYNDGASVNVMLCGNAITTNHAGTDAFGGGLFFTSNDFGGTLSVIDTTMSGNTGRYWTQVATGTASNAGTAIGTNTKSLTIVRSMLQGAP